MSTNLLPTWFRMFITDCKLTHDKGICTCSMEHLLNHSMLGNKNLKNSRPVSSRWDSNHVIFQRLCEGLQCDIRRPTALKSLALNRVLGSFPKHISKKTHDDDVSQKKTVALPLTSCFIAFYTLFESPGPEVPEVVRSLARRQHEVAHV